MSALIELKDTKMVFKVRKGWFSTLDLRAVDGVSLSIGRGNTTGIVGESGSGKTTLGRVSLRLLEPTAGKVLFDGKDITEVKESNLKWFRRKAQGIFQDPYSSLNPYMTVERILEEPLVLHEIGSDREREELISKALTDVKLTPTEEFAGKYPHMLSGGQRQRVGVARSLILNPEYIVADEPVSMIDASSRVEVLSLLRGLQEKYRIGFMYITHDIATSKYFSERIAVMYLGRIVEFAEARTVIAEPLHPYTQALIAAVPDPDPSNRLHDRSVVPGEPPNPINVPSGCRFHPRCPRFMKNKCEIKEPVLREVKRVHQVACYLYD